MLDKSINLPIRPDGDQMIDGFRVAPQQMRILIYFDQSHAIGGNAASGIGRQKIAIGEGDGVYPINDAFGQIPWYVFHMCRMLWPDLVIRKRPAVNDFSLHIDE